MHRTTKAKLFIKFFYKTKVATLLRPFFLLPQPTIKVSIFRAKTNNLYQQYKDALKQNVYPLTHE